jgi:uncharacterized protein (TIGR02246 family)
MDDVVEAISELERRRFAAMLAGDFDDFAAVCDPDLIYTHSTGATDSLESYLAKCRAGYYVYHRIEHPVAKIVVAGPTSLVLGEMHADLTVGGVRKQLRNSSLAVWVNRAGAWRLIAYQPTPLP